MKSSQPCNVSCEITGHAIDENHRREPPYIVSGYKKVSNGNQTNEVSRQNTANEASNQEIAVQHKRTPLVPIYHVQQQGQMHQAMGSNPGFQPAEFSGFPPRFPLQSQYRMEAFSCAAPVPSQNYTGCTFNFFSRDSQNSPPQPQKKRRAYIIESDDEDWTLTLHYFSELLRTSRISWMKVVFLLIRLTEFLTHDVKVFLFCISGSAFYLKTGSVLHQ